MQELILSTNGNGSGECDGDGDDGESSLSGGAVRNTSDRRTDPNMSCIVCMYVCMCFWHRVRESESIGFGVTVCGKRRVEKYERERERERRGKKVGVIVFEKRKIKMK